MDQFLALLDHFGLHLSASKMDQMVGPQGLLLEARSTGKTLDLQDFLELRLLASQMY